MRIDESRPSIPGIMGVDDLVRIEVSWPPTTAQTAPQVARRPASGARARPRRTEFRPEDRQLRPSDGLSWSEQTHLGACFRCENREELLERGNLRIGGHDARGGRGYGPRVGAAYSIGGRKHPSGKGGSGSPSRSLPTAS